MEIQNINSLSTALPTALSSMLCRRSGRCISAPKTQSWRSMMADSRTSSRSFTTGSVFFCFSLLVLEGEGMIWCQPWRPYPLPSGGDAEVYWLADQHLSFFSSIQPLLFPLPPLSATHNSFFTPFLLNKAPTRASSRQPRSGMNTDWLTTWLPMPSNPLAALSGLARTTTVTSVPISSLKVCATILLPPSFSLNTTTLGVPKVFYHDETI